MQRHLVLVLILGLAVAGSVSARQRSWGGPREPFGPALRAVLPAWAASPRHGGMSLLHEETVSSGRFVYVGTRRGLSRSVDGGRTWTLHPVAPGEPPVQTLVAHGPLVWVGTPAGAFRSEDAGRTWAPTDVGMGRADVRHMIRAATGTLFAATASTGGCALFRSRSDGQLWSCIDPDVEELRIGDLREDEDGRITVTFDGAAFRTADEGHTWNRIAAPRASDTTLATLPADRIVHREPWSPRMGPRF